MIQDKHDVVTYGKEGIEVCVKGTLKHCVGIGDVLSGICSLFCYYAKLYSKSNGDILRNSQLHMCAAACILTRSASNAAFLKLNRSLTTPFIIKELGECFNKLFESNYYQK